MKQVQQARLDALHRIRAFMDENAAALGNVNKSTSRIALDDVLAKLDDRAKQQVAAETNAASATHDKNALREDLRLHHMQPIAAIARATLAHVPLIARLRFPGPRVNDSTLIQRGAAMGEVAAQYADVFIGEQLPVTFLDELKASVDAVRSAAVQRDLFQGKVTQATQGMDEEMLRAHNVVKILNTLVVKQLKGKNDLLAAGRRLKHPKAKPGVPQGTTSSVVPATSPVPVPASTADAQQAASA